MWKIIFAPDTFGRHIGHVLQSATPDQDNVVLLRAMFKYATFNIQTRRLDRKSCATWRL